MTCKSNSITPVLTVVVVVVVAMRVTLEALPGIWEWNPRW